MFELVININCIYVKDVFLLVRVTYVTFYEIADNDFIECILELTISSNLKWVLKIFIQWRISIFIYFKLLTTCNLQ